MRFLPGFHAVSGSSVDAVIITDGSFCEDYASLSLLNAQAVVEKSVGVNEGKDEGEPAGTKTKDIKVYPNPNNGRFVVEIPNVESPVELSVYRVTGALVYRKAGVLPGSVEIEASYLNPGFYQVLVSGAASVMSVKMVVR